MASEKRFRRVLKGFAAILFVILAVMLRGATVSADNGGIPDHVEISDFRMDNPNPTKEPLEVKASADRRTFTVDDTVDWDFETLKTTSAQPRISFKTNVERIGLYDKQYGNMPVQISVKYLFSGQFDTLRAEILPYNTDPNYVIAKFTVYVIDMTGAVTTKYRPIDSTRTEFTLRLKKWEKQYQKQEKSPVWTTGPQGSYFYCSAYEYGSKSVPFKLVSPHHYEYIAAENVTFPYTVTIYCGIHYQTDAYLEGKRMLRPVGNKPYEKKLTFTENKQYYDMVIDPLSSMDDKHTIGVKSHWRIKVTGKAASGLKSTTKSQLSYSLKARTYNGRAQGISVSPKSGAGKVTAVYYTGTGGTIYRKTTAKPTGAGTYAVTVNVAAGSKYKAVNGLSLGSFKINKADISQLEITAANISWTGKQVRPRTFQYNDKNFSISENATVKSYGANRNIGKGTVRLAGKGNFTGTKTVTFKIVPKKTVITGITSGRRQMKVKWKKVHRAQRITRYELRYRVRGSSRWVKTTHKSAASAATLKRLKKGRTYQVQVRSYKTVSGRKYYSAWSRTKGSRKIK